MIKINYTNGIGFATGGEYTGVITASSGFSSNPVEETFNPVDTCDYLYIDGDTIDVSGKKKFWERGDYTGAVANAMHTSITVDYEGNFDDISNVGLTIQFNGNCATWCDVYLYKENGYPVTRLNKEIDNNGTLYLNDISMTDCRKIRITNIVPRDINYRIKLESVALGDVSKGSYEEIKSHNLIEEIDILSQDLPINQFEATIAATTSPKINDKIKVYSNDKYYGTFWIDEVNMVAKSVIEGGNNLYAFTAGNAISKLDKTTFFKWFSSWYSTGSGQSLVIDNAFAGTRLSTFIDDVFEQTGIHIISNAVDLTDRAVIGNIGTHTHRYNLAAMAWAIAQWVDASRSDKIELKSVPSTNTAIKKHYTNNDIIGEAIYTAEPVVTSMKYYRFSNANFEEIQVDNEPQSVDENSIYFKLPSTSPDTKVLEYDPSVISIENRGTPVGSFDVYANEMRYKTYSKTTYLRIPFVTSHDIYEYDINTASVKNVIELNAYGDIAGIKSVSNVSGATVFAGSDDVFTGTKINRKDAIGKVYHNAGKVNAKVILTDERLGDLVQIDTNFGETIEGVITRMNVHFGYQDIADIEITQYDKEWVTS